VYLLIVGVKHLPPPNFITPRLQEFH
jgi:hypothetical protein